MLTPVILSMHESPSNTKAEVPNSAFRDASLTVTAVPALIASAITAPLLGMVLL